MFTTIVKYKLAYFIIVKEAIRKPSGTSKVRYTYY